jgi:hypothetical protein
MMNCVTVPTFLGPPKTGRPKKNKCKKSIAEYIKQSAKKNPKTTKSTKTPEEERVDLEGQDVKMGRRVKLSQ